MSSYTFTNTHDEAREARQLIKGAIGAITKRERGSDPKVLRNSYDVDDDRAKVFRPIGDGSKRGALAWIDAYLKTAREYDRKHRAPGGKRPLGHTAILVLEVILGRHGTVNPDFRTGRIDPAIATIARIAGLAKTTVLAALDKLKEHKFIFRVRRSRKTHREGEFAPQREQTSNAYYFDITRLCREAYQRVKDLLAAKMRNSPPDTPDEAQRAVVAAPSGPVAAALARFGQSVCNASPE